MTGCKCENTGHADRVPDAVARIKLIALPEAEGFCVCPSHLIAYLEQVYLDQHTDLRLAFVVEPT